MLLIIDSQTEKINTFRRNTMNEGSTNLVYLFKRHRLKTHTFKRTSQFSTFKLIYRNSTVE